MHTFMHANMHTGNISHTIRTRTNTYMHICIQIHTCIYVYLQEVYAYLQIHTCIYVYKYIHAYMYTNTYMHVCIPARGICIPTNTYMHICIQMHTCIYVYKCIHAYMYTNTYMLVYLQDLDYDIYLRTCIYVYKCIHAYMYTCKTSTTISICERAKMFVNICAQTVSLIID